MRILKLVAIALLALAAAQTAVAGHGGPGVHETPLLDSQGNAFGVLKVWNKRQTLNLVVEPEGPWAVREVSIYVGAEPVPMAPSGNPILGKFPYRVVYPKPADRHVLELSLKDDIGFGWGIPYKDLRIQNIAVHAILHSTQKGKSPGAKLVWAYGDNAFKSQTRGWWLTYNLTHPLRGHIVDSPVEGIHYQTPSNTGLTEAGGAFDYFPGEKVALSVGEVRIGEAMADHRVTPLDLFEDGEIGHPGVVGVARFLQTLDSDRTPKNGIRITESTVACVNAAAEALNTSEPDFTDAAQVDVLIGTTVAFCSDLVAVSAEDAMAHLDAQLSSSMFRKNVSKTPEMLTAKSKLDFMNILVPATKANGDPVLSDELGGGAVGVDYYDEEGNYLYSREKVHPLVSVYADENEDSPTLASDVFAAVSRDDGASWKRMNLSRAADRSSFTLENGQDYYGDVKKPNLSIKGNYVLTAWQSKFCRGGRPRYSLDEYLDDGETLNPYYVDDIYGVGGPQRSHDYTEDGFPEVGELPFYCLWVARGVIDPATGDMKWRKPERLTSGRRDVYQISINGANNVGFGVVWQEDPEGVRPGEMAGPGHGWSGATTNHKTDIWYSFIKWSDFATIDENFTPNGDPHHSFDDPEWTTNRPMPLVPFAMPLRMSDNDVCNTDNMKVALDAEGLPVKDESGQYIPLMDEDGKHAGTHRYCYLQPGLCTAFHTFENSQYATKNVCVTADGRLLDGDTGASRPNLSFMPYTKPDGTQSAWIAIAYEETKGVGAGKPEWDDDPDTTHGEEKDKPDLGKNVIYHSFDFASPVKVAGGDIVNLPALDEAGNLLYLVDKEGNQVLDWQGQPQLAYENARRPRMLVQPAGQAGSSGTVMAMVYKQGEEGKGRPSDIMLRRVKKGASGNPYAFANFVGGAQNLSSVTPAETWTNPDQDDNAKGEGLKVVKYEQTAANLADASWTNPYDDARAHRGILRGNNLFLAYDYTPNWAASRNAHDKYDLFIRRSFDGGVTWTTDPLGMDEVCHTNVWKEYTNDEDGTPLVSEDEANKKDTYEETVCFEPGAFEPARNMSQLKNNKLSVIEPRLVGPPSSTPGSLYAEDKQNLDVFYVTFGTATNVPKPHGNQEDEEEEESAVPADLYYTFTRDRGQTFFKRLWEVNPDSSGNYAGETVERTDYLAKGDPEQGEAQIRMVPDGSRFYAVWNQEGEEGSDTWFRRIMSMDFPQNMSPETVLEPETP